MKSFKNMRLSVDFNGLKINGWLSGNAVAWTFKSRDPLFLRLCPTRHMFSDRHYGDPADRQNIHGIVHTAISQKIVDLRRSSIANNTTRKKTSSK
jgi:hypothetical protein